MTHRSARTLVVFAGLLTCSTALGTADPDTPIEAAPETDAEMPIALGTTPDLTGTWYLRMRTATDARVPIIGTTLVKSTTHLLVTIEKKGSQHFQSQKTCAVDTRPSRKLTRTVLPKAFIDHLAEKTYPIRITASEAEEWDYYADLKQQFVGYHGNLAPDGIPQNGKHPAVFDWDEDGKPGASVLVDIPIIGHIRIYLVQTNHTFLNGRITKTGSIEGKTHQRLLQQRTIGADNRLLAASPKLSVAEGHDAFEMVRIDHGSSCADIKRIAADSF